MLKNLCRIMGLSALFLSTSLFASNPLPAPANTPPQPLNGIVAVVNNDIITQKDFDQALVSARTQAEQRHIKIQNEADFKKQVLNQLIYQHLQLQIAKNNGLTASKKEIDDTINQIIQHSGLSKKAFTEKLKHAGISYSTFRSEIKKQVITDKLQHQALGDKVRVTDADVIAFRKAHHILNDTYEYHVIDTVVALPDDASKEAVKTAKQKALRVAQALKNNTLADDSDTHDLGWVTLEDLPELFVKPIKAMTVDGVSQPIQAANGFHIIQLIGRQKNKKAMSDDQVRSFVVQEKFYKALKPWLTQLREAAYVHINPGYLS